MGGQTPLWVQMLIAWTPFILFAFFLMLFTQREQSRQKRVMEHIERSEQHMQRVEELLTRTVDALEGQTR